MPATVVSRASKSILDLTDGGNLTAYLTANQPTTQVFNSNTEMYSPDWSTSNLVITPLVYIDQSPVSVTSSKLSITWKRKEGNGSETNLTTGETVTASGNSKYTLTVSANKLASISSGILTYVAHIDYTIYHDASNPSNDKTVSSTVSMTFSLVKSGDSRVIYIVGDQVFRISSDGQTTTPSEITLTAITQNVNVGSWQYWDESGNTPQWRTYPGSQSGDTSITVDPAHNVFNDGIASIRVVAASPHANLYDTMTVYKIQDGLVGQNAQITFLTNENVTFAGNKSGKVAESVKFCNVVAYNGETKTTPTVGTLSGAPSGMKVVKGSTTAPTNPESGDVWYDISSTPTLKKYDGSSWTTVATGSAIPANEVPLAIYIAANATLGGSGEKSGTINVPVSSPVSTTLQIRWSKVNTGATGAQGNPGANAKLITVTGDQIFKVDAGGNVTPSTITLTAYVQNTTFDKWQYKNSSDNWVDYPTGTITNTTLTVAPTHAIWNDNAATLRAIDTDGTVYDTISLFKAVDGTNGTNSKIVYLTNENVTFAADKDGKIAAITITTYVVGYDGTTKTTPTVGTISGAPTGMTVTKQSASNNEIPIQIKITANSDLGGSSGTLSIPVTAPASTTLQFRWSKANTGGHGVNVATVYLYQRAANTPSVPSGDCTYNFSTGVLSGDTLGQWTQSIPDSTDPCYVTLATASSAEATDTIGTSEWASPVVLVKNGTNGASGTNGYNQATIYLYQRNSTSPSQPIAGQTYTFSTGALSDVPTGWSTSVPATNGNPCYMTTAAAISRTATATISGWSTPTKLVEDGEKGDTGDKGDKGDTGDPGQDACLLTIAAPNGTVFTHSGSVDITTIQLNAIFYKGSTNISSTSYFRWQRYNGSSWTTVQSEKEGSSGGSSYIASASDVTTSTIYRCRARETSSSSTYFYDYITLIDKTDNYQSAIGSTAGDVFQNSVGDSELYCRVWQNGTEVDPLKATTFSKTLPAAPAIGNPFYYHVIDLSTATSGGTAPTSPTLNQLWLDTSGSTSVLKRYNGTTWVTVTDAHQTLLMRWSGSAWVDVTNDSTYKHTLTYEWYRMDIDGEPMDGGAVFTTGKVIHVGNDDVEGKTTFICQVTDGAQTPTLLSQTQFSIRDDTDITVGSEIPDNPVQSQLWLDTGVTPNLLKKYNATTQLWDIVNDTSGIYTEMSTQIGNAKTEVLGTVDTKIAEVTMTKEKFTVMFGETVKTGIDDAIDSVQDNLEEYQDSVSNYMRFDSNGVLELGQTGNNFKTQITNTKLSFLEGSVEIAYVSNQSMYITTARVTDTLSIGTNNGYGYFDWTVTPTGLGLKWRGEPPFDPNYAYQMGDLCNHENHIYECLINMTEPDGEWIEAHWQQRI